MKTILHLCADVGSDSQPYTDAGYNVIRIGKEIGVENYKPPNDVYGIFANPPCTEFSIAKNSNTDGLGGMLLVDHCMSIISLCRPKFWVLENPAAGKLKNYLGKPTYTYEPWHYGSPWTKRTALWGVFNIPTPKFSAWEDVPKNSKIYVRPGRKASLAWLHKSSVHDIPEFQRFSHMVHDDMSLRSLCSQKFAKAFFDVNQ